MKKFIFICFALVVLCGCVNKHPYQYTINDNFPEMNKSISSWNIEDIGNDSSVPMSAQKQLDLTTQIQNYLKDKGINATISNQTSNNICNNCFTVKPKIIETMAEISQNEAGWHGTSEDPLNFWSHFSGGSGMQFVDGAVPALSLYVAVYSGKQKYYENAGGIELLGKYNKFSFRMTNKKELIEDPKRFQKAMDIAFKPLMEVIK